MEALYVHIPFCSKICTYCDFYKMQAKLEIKTKYIEYLIKELEMKKHLLNNLQTIYIGGGTPTALPIHLLDYLFFHIKRLVRKNIIEFTIEANPNDISDDLVRLLKKYSINRISLGVQSFDQSKLNFLGREHTRKQSVSAIKILKKHRFPNINVDLIYATPDDNFKSVKKDLITLVNLNVDHISAYSLILEEKTILNYKLRQQAFIPLGEDQEYNIYKKLRNFLEKFGYHQYEISNYAKKNYQSKHNLVYWSNKNYLGIGAGASYYIDNVRYTNVMNLNHYFEGIGKSQLNYQEQNQLTPLEQMQEHVILGFRKTNGIDINHFQEKFNQDIYEVFPTINQLIERDLIKLRNNKLYIPRSKLYLSNSVLIDFI